ncbi:MULTISPECIES: DUF3224 domain-containing protein [Pseudoalteromonas]|uniref:DUF3224 domain-containing protein n=1 Tax=Pseudoalteromonas neustonica TaxID=1840331 RepID=A0ABU9U776_9GAMM
MELKGTFLITKWQETVEQQFEKGQKFSTALVQQAYSGDINGNSEVRYQLYYSEDGDALFNGFETITYDKNDEQVVLTLKHDGKFESGVASSEFTIVDSSHECSLIDKSGTFRSIEGGKGIYQIS